MNDFLLNWSVNIAIQFTCVSACGMAMAKLLRRRTAARSAVLFSTLILALLIPPITAAMLWSNLSLVSIDLNIDATRNADSLLDSKPLDGQQILNSDRHHDRSAMNTADNISLMSDRTSHSSSHNPSPSNEQPLASADVRTGELTGDAFGGSASRRQAKSTAVGRTLAISQATGLFTYAPMLVTFLSFVWIVGTAVFLVRLAVIWWRVRMLLQRSEPSANEMLTRMLPRIAREFDRARLPVVVVSERVSGPISAGIIRPRIVLPKSLCDRISSDQLHDVLIHELAHIIRRDQITAFLQNIASAFYWPHPMIRWLNRMLAQTREEVCDNYVLSSTSAPAYSRTLLALAELASPHSAMPGTVGLFTSNWKLEHRVRGLLDDKRNRMLNLKPSTKLFMAAIAFSIANVAGCGTIRIVFGQQTQKIDESEQLHTVTDATTANPTSDRTRPARVPLLRGRGQNVEMRLHGSVLEIDGSPAKDFEVKLNVRKGFGQKAADVEVKEHQFESWIPIGGNDGFFLELSAQSRDGRRRAMLSLGDRELRQAAIEGIQLPLAQADRVVAVTVIKDNQPVTDAHVVAGISFSAPVQCTTNQNGQATFAILPDEKLEQLTAWTDNFLIGGYDFSRQPRHDPLGTNFTIELEDCRPQTVRFLREDDNSPIPNVAFNLVIGTGPPNYNFAAVPASFPHVRMTTDSHGEATCRWFPDWKQHGAYVDIVDPTWAKTLEELETASDGALVMKLKPRVKRQLLYGKVTSPDRNVGGLLVKIQSFQAEEENHADHISAFTDESGEFFANCIPGSTYCVFVDDAELVSNTIDLIPYEPDTEKSNRAELALTEGQLIKISVTSGPKRRSMPRTWVYFREIYDYSWYENGERKNGSSGRSWGVYTDERGIALARASIGSKLEASVNAGEWRSDERVVTVAKDNNPLVEFHREIDIERTVTGQLVAPPGMDVNLADAEVIYGSIDGETDERESLKADSTGRFIFSTRAIQFGIVAYTADGTAAGVLKPAALDRPLELQLWPTADLQGRLLGEGDVPLANHAVRVTPTLQGERYLNKTFSTGFSTKTFETRTDEQGNYALKQLPTKLAMRLRADPIDNSGRDAYLEEFVLEPGEERPLMVSQLKSRTEKVKRSLAEEYAHLLRDAKLNDFHLLVSIFDSTSDDFVGRYLTDSESTKDAIAFMNLEIREKNVTDDADRKFVESHDWPQPKRGDVFLCVLDGRGNKIGQATLHTRDDEAKLEAAEFLREFAPPQSDAKEKWGAAFAEAARSGRKVWARVGQRYCGSCFRLSRWLDENRGQLEREYVFLKVDDTRDKHGVEIADRIFGKRGHGIPFHAIYDSREKLLIDSEGPTGNIGHPSSFEGRKHLRRMLVESRVILSDDEIDEIVATLK